MHKLLVDNVWYETVPPNGIPDTDYENLLGPHAATLYPGFHLVPLRYRVSVEQESCSPHLALVDKAYRSWWLALLETGAAPTSKFVSQQARILRSARYGRDFATLLAERCSALDVRAVEELTRREQPGLYVIVGHPPGPSMTDPSIRIGIAEIFRSSAGMHIFRINGSQPESPDERVGTCTRNPYVQANVLRLKLRELSPATIPPRCEIEIEGYVSTWTARPNNGGYYLVPDGTAPLPVEQDIFALVRSNTGRLRLLPQNG
jgi:hypothetical protein